MNLSELKVGEWCRVIKLGSMGHLRRRLYDMGITPGCEVYLKKLAPLGDPMQISLRGYELTIRKEDAQSILVESAVHEEGERVKKEKDCSGVCSGCNRRGKC